MTTGRIDTETKRDLKIHSLIVGGLALWFTSANLVGEKAEDFANKSITESNPEKKEILMTRAEKWNKAAIHRISHSF